MEVIAIADRKNYWRWEIRHQGKVIKESRASFATLAEAITEGKRHLLNLWTEEDRPPITRKSQSWRRPRGF